MTQRELAIAYIQEFGSIVPARMTGKVFMGTLFGSEISRACRSLRAKGDLASMRFGKFEKFFLSNMESMSL